MIITLSFDDAHQYTDPDATLIDLDTFLSDCENEILTENAGFACEIVHGNRVLSDKFHDIADYLDEFNRSTLLAAQNLRGTIYIAWYHGKITDDDMGINV